MRYMPESSFGPLATVATLFGTRPEIIKVAPVIAELERRPRQFRTVNICSGQQADLIEPLVEWFNLRIDHDLRVMRPGQPLNLLFARVLETLDPLLDRLRPQVLLVQGDTTTAAAGALAAFQRRIPVGHIEAGLRTGDPYSPFPEEMNRRLITKLAKWHFAGTANHVRTLLAEGVDAGSIFHTGNPVVDALNTLGGEESRSERLNAVLERTKGLKRIAVTTHRRENFAGKLEDNLRVLRRFVERHEDTAIIFPMHPNPIVRENAYNVLAGHDRIELTEPFDYPEFIALLKASWLIASDSGGVQEEAPSLGKQLLVMRESTERPEALETGFVKLAGTPQLLAAMLKEAYDSDSHAVPTVNPFGDGKASQRIADVLADQLSPKFAEVAA
jgi:UDP-N-acetylglucosamine 2-epimerase (non-hydrolysing)